MPGAHGYYATYLPLVAIIAIGVLLVVAMFSGNRLLRPTHSTPEKLLTSLRELRDEVHVDPEIAARARGAVEAMIAIGQPGGGE